MEVTEIKDNVITLDMTEEENRCLVECAVNHILRECIDKLKGDMKTKRLIVSDLERKLLVLRTDLTSVNVSETRYSVRLKIEGPQGNEDIFVPRKNTIIMIRDEEGEEDVEEEKKGKAKGTFPLMLPVLMK